MQNEQIIKKMLKLIERLQGFIADIDYDVFFGNAMLIDACVFNLSQLGEYAGKIEETYKKKNADIPWHEVYGLRNKIVHDYEGVKLDLIWEILKDDIPVLKKKLENL